jgi:hypothetical protein
MSADKEVRAFITDAVIQQRLAKYIVLRCFRNSMLEDLHAGIPPSSAIGDYSDVSVSSPYGVIPWPELSRFNGRGDEAPNDRCGQSGLPPDPHCSMKRPALNSFACSHNTIHFRDGISQPLAPPTSNAKIRATKDLLHCCIRVRCSLIQIVRYQSPRSCRLSLENMPQAVLIPEETGL